MACKTSFELHHNFPKIAEESGFTFNTHKPRVRIEWNKIRLIDIETLMRDRKFILIEQHLNDILDCVLESEFDVRILDEGVLKIFRLAQLTVEYQQFCRHYLDRSVYVLREEITALAQELDYVRKTIREKDEEIRKYKRKTKHNFLGQIPNGNDNIANMILQTLTNRGDIFPNTTKVDNIHYNKCTYCDKFFMNQLYLKSHISRRHSSVAEIPQKDLERDVVQQVDNEQSKLQNEITELKTKLKEMEVFIKIGNVQNNSRLNLETNNMKTDSMPPKEDRAEINKNNTSKCPEKQMNDAEVSTYGDDYILEKLEEWKKEEHEKYNTEISLLRTQITSIIEFNKDAERVKSMQNDNKMMEQLHETIKEQSAEISSLKEDLLNSRLRSNIEEIDRKKEIEAQIAFWTEQAEVQSKEHKLLLQKLDIVAKEAQESRENAELEKKRAVKLQLLLEQNINNETTTSNHDTDGRTRDLQQSVKPNENLVETNIKSPKKRNPVPDRKTLEKLHRRAQELLNQSITSSDVSCTSDNKNHVPIKKKKKPNNKVRKKKKISAEDVKKRNYLEDDSMKKVNQNILQLHTNVDTQELRKNKSPSKKSNGSVPNYGSPLKVVRAKLTEEVNQRLVSLGVDPLKKSLPRDIYQRHRLQLQENSEIKMKKNPAHESVKHSIMSYLDNKAAITKNETLHIDEYVSLNRTWKPFSITSVISNVKSKALSLVKANEVFKKENRGGYETVTKKALSLLKTPPESATSSPKITKQNYDKQFRTTKEITRDQQKYGKYDNSTLKNSYIGKMQKVSETSNGSDTDTTGSFQSSEREMSTEKSTQNKIKSSNQRPTRSNIHEPNIQKQSEVKENKLVQIKHITDVLEKTDINTQKCNMKLENNEDSSDDNVVSTTEHELRNAVSDENVYTQKQTKGLLKSASSLSSLYKKKVLFDMDAIQMKSFSPSSSQSVADKGGKDDKYDLGTINIDTEEWDISSIENEPIRNEKTIKINSRTSPKIAELKKSIESQLTRRNQTLCTTPVGGVDVLKGPITKASLGGSNTSLGSSILDESNSVLHQIQTAFIKPKNITEKDDSEIDISELIVGGNNNTKRKYF